MRTVAIRALVIVLALAAFCSAEDTVIFGGRTYQRKVFHVSENIAGEQYMPSCCFTNEGNLAVSWNKTPFGSLYARQFDETGKPVTGDIYMSGSPSSYSDMVARSNGSFIVTWQQSAPAGIFARIIEADGTYATDTFRVNNLTGGQYSKVAVNANDEAFIVWENYQFPTATNVFGRRFDAFGQPITDEFLVNTTMGNDQELASIAVGDNGEWLVVWCCKDGRLNIAGQRYVPAGQPLGDEFCVNDPGVATGKTSHVDMNSAGQTVIAWEENEHVMIRRYDPNGNPLGLHQQITDSPRYQMEIVGVAIREDGSFVVGWRENYYSSPDGYAQEVGSDGIPVGAPLLISTCTGVYKGLDDLDVGPNGEIAFVWFGDASEFDPDGGAFVTLLIPEPATLALLTLGALVMIRRRRK